MLLVAVVKEIKSRYRVLVYTLLTEQYIHYTIKHPHNQILVCDELPTVPRN